MASAGSRREFFLRVLLVVGVSTVLLTASFVGVLAVLNGEFETASGRIPWYFVISAGVFVATIILLEEGGADGSTIIISALLFSTLGFGLISLAVEGVLFAINYPELVFISQLVLYFFAAGLIGSGIGYWALNHWREFSKTSGAL
jgi:hypothetical protein